MPAAASTAQRLRRSSARLTTAALARMSELPWFAELPPEERSYVALVVQAGLDELVGWLRDTTRPPHADPAIFAAAPRALARAVTLQQTVQLIRLTVEVLESAIGDIAPPANVDALEHAVLRFSREVAFAAAEVYAAAAEERGAWDARAEASVVDALLRGDVGEAVLTRAGSLGWLRGDWVTVLAGRLPASGDAHVTELRAAARRSELCILVGEHGGELLVVLGGSGPSAMSIEQVAGGFPAGPVVVGPIVPELAAAATSLAETRAGLAAVAAWPDAPRPVQAGRLLAERAVLGDLTATHRLLKEVHAPLLAAPDLYDTVTAFLAVGGRIEATARRQYLHPNTVRYRLGKAQERIGRDVTSERGAFEVRIALVLGRVTAPPM